MRLLNPFYIWFPQLHHYLFWESNMIRNKVVQQLHSRTRWEDETRLKDIFPLWKTKTMYFFLCILLYNILESCLLRARIFTTIITRERFLSPPLKILFRVLLEAKGVHRYLPLLFIKSSIYTKSIFYTLPNTILWEIPPKIVFKSTHFIFHWIGHVINSSQITEKSPTEAHGINEGLFTEKKILPKSILPFTTIWQEIYSKNARMWKMNRQSWMIKSEHFTSLHTLDHIENGL